MGLPLLHPSERNERVDAGHATSKRRGVIHPEGVAKEGAGMMFLSEGDVLLLLRNSRHNDETWGLPGGNVEPVDGGVLFATAKREAIEEMGPLPPFTLAGTVHTTRGKNNDKHYAVFLCTVSKEVKEGYIPYLNHEHSDWRWFELDEAVLRADMHPVVDKVFERPHRPQVLAAAGLAPDRHGVLW